MKFTPWLAIFRNLKGSRVQGVQGPSEMIKNYREPKVWRKAYQTGIIRYFGKLLAPMNPRTLEPFSKGFTLIEMVIVIVILSIISAITINFLVDSLKIYTMTVNQKTLFDEGKLAMERMCRDVRDARSLSAPAAGASGSTLTFTRDNATAQDSAAEAIRFTLSGTTLQKRKSLPGVLLINLASNVSTFTVTRGAAATNNANEITILLTLSLASGENLTLQTKVYPKNLADSTTYKIYFQNWQEELSS
jgi:prepilin-type N-terminal cleavage/methylation domain-containing protein